MEFSGTIDYLTITGKHDLQLENSLSAINLAAVWASDVLEKLGCDRSGVLNTGKPVPFYRYVFEDKSYGTMVYLSESGQSQGFMVRFSGEALRKQHNPPAIAQKAALLGFKITRVDVAFDFLNCDESAANLYALYDASESDGRKLKTQVIFGPTGDTFYLGSRSSDRMVRTYDKGRQQGLDATWTRIELELKGDLAASNGLAVALDSRIAARMIVDAYGETGSELLSVLADYADGIGTELVKPPRVQSDRVRWLRTQVLSAFKTLADDDPETARQIVSEFAGVLAASDTARMSKVE